MTSAQHGQQAFDLLVVAFSTSLIGYIYRKFAEEKCAFGTSWVAADEYGQTYRTCHRIPHFAMHLMEQKTE